MKHNNVAYKIKEQHVIILKVLFYWSFSCPVDSHIYHWARISTRIRIEFSLEYFCKHQHIFTYIFSKVFTYIWQTANVFCRGCWPNTRFLGDSCFETKLRINFNSGQMWLNKLLNCTLNCAEWTKDWTNRMVTLLYEGYWSAITNHIRWIGGERKINAFVWKIGI